MRSSTSSAMCRARRAPLGLVMMSDVELLGGVWVLVPGLAGTLKRLILFAEKQRASLSSDLIRDTTPACARCVCQC